MWPFRFLQGADNGFPFLLKGSLGILVGFWTDLPLLVIVLLQLMLIDIITGLLKAWIDRKINSRISFLGLTRKIMTLLLIWAGAILESTALPELGLPLVNIIAAFYVAQESLSIIENAAYLGLPVPDFLKNILEQLRKRMNQGSPVEINAEKVDMVDADEIEVIRSGNKPREETDE